MSWFEKNTIGKRFRFSTTGDNTWQKSKYVPRNIITKNTILYYFTEGIIILVYFPVSMLKVNSLSHTEDFEFQLSQEENAIAAMSGKVNMAARKISTTTLTLILCSLKYTYANIVVKIGTMIKQALQLDLFRFSLDLRLRPQTKPEPDRVIVPFASILYIFTFLVFECTRHVNTIVHFFFSLCLFILFFMFLLSNQSKTRKSRRNVFIEKNWHA